MNITDYPKAYQSAFRPAAFVLENVVAPDGLDVSILSAAGNSPLGVKRIYGHGRMAVNAAPYVRGLLSPEPLCSRPMGVSSDARRCAGCRVEAAGVVSAVIWLTAGTQDAPIARTLSAAEGTVKIRGGEKDEISVISGGGAVKPFVKFVHAGTEHTVETWGANSGTGMHTFVVDADEVARLFVQTTGTPAHLMQGFTAMLRVAASHGDVYLSRTYEFDPEPHGGRRLAWVNRYGAIDYHTFPAVAERGVSGAKERISTADGVQVVATRAGEWLTLVSEYETTEILGRLAEIFSSPRVWVVEGDDFDAADVADATVGFDPTKPGRLTVKVRPASMVVSRKF